MNIRGNIPGKIREFLKKPYTIPIIACVVGIILGLVWAWMIQPVVWKDVPPAQLGTYYQDEYLRMAVDSYVNKPDDTLAIQRYQALGAAGPVTYERIKAGYPDQNAIQNFAEVVHVVPISTPTPSGGKTSASGGALLSIVIIAIAVLLVGVVGYFVFRMLRPKFKRTGKQTPAQQAQEITRQTEMTDFEGLGVVPPLAHFITSYVLGDDLLDKSKGINSADGEYVGECGVEISETLPLLEKPKRVSAFEVWLFDKKDIQTVTKVLMSEHAYHDDAIYQRLAAKGEPVLAQPGQIVELDTRALRLRVKVVEVAYGTGAPPEASYFDRLTLELAVWPKVVVPE